MKLVLNDVEKRIRIVRIKIQKAKIQESRVRKWQVKVAVRRCKESGARTTSGKILFSL
jgi:hypothetical protein